LLRLADGMRRLVGWTGCDKLPIRRTQSADKETSHEEE
jgi:hypothetical protein